MRVWEAIEKFFLGIARKIKLGFLADFYEKHLEGMRYLAFGFFSTVINIVTFKLCKMAGMGTIISNILAWVVAVVFAYLTNKAIVFESKTESIKSLFKEFVSFIGARIFTLVVETIFLKVVIDILGYNEILMKIVSNIIVIILNFIFSKLFIFNKDKSKESKESKEEKEEKENLDNKEN